ncbi:Dicer-like protein 2 [Entomortierella chlamydospora]|uniref:Dicer-like protein 2 n=1 Tax=Entomortierella chlamydospora TaxID=101097 RepID=A0A9P6MTZ6_9FUNG|nr:Dicer-like protein 2 [Entomortierella chlamydospora]KAG0013295.1 Dicer-like protein 2 [Entomortierella chlamydospora]
MQLRPSVTLPIGRPSPSFGNIALAAPVQDRLGLRSIPLSVLRVILTPRMDETPGDCLPALGVAFLKFLLAAYFFTSYQDETEGALTTRIQNESSRAALASYISTSGLACNICTGLYDPKFDDNVATTVFRDILGAAIVFGGLDYAIHVARSIGMAIDRTTISMQGLKVIYVLNRTFDNMFVSTSAADPWAMQRIQTVELALGYRFQDPKLVIEATTHNSVENAASYERLELLGNAVLEYAVAEYYYFKDPSVRINDFRKAKSRRLCNDALGTLCVYLHLDEVIAVDEQVIRDEITECVAKVHDRILNGVRGWENMNLSKVLGDAFEAVVGALSVDAGFELRPMRGVLGRILIPFVEENDV